MEMKGTAETCLYAFWGLDMDTKIATYISFMFIETEFFIQRDSDV